MTLIKKILKTLNKLYFSKHPLLNKNNIGTFDYVFYLKEPISHIIFKEILASGIQNYLVIVDDQFGFKSDYKSYQAFIRVKTKFTWQNFFKIFRNEFALLEETIKDNQEIFQDSNFIPIYDRSQEMEYIIPKYRHVFKKIITIQHGSLGNPDAYFPFLSDIFIARSYADAKIAMQYSLNNNQHIVVGGNITSSYISPNDLKYNIEKKFHTDNENILYAGRFGLLFNIRFIMSAICTAKESSPVYFKAHPSDKMKYIYYSIIYISHLFGKEIYITKNLFDRDYKYLVTESSSLILELLREGTLPIIINPNKIKLPYYVESWLFSTKKCIDIKEVEKYYQNKVDILENYYFNYSYQNEDYKNISMLYKKLLEFINENETLNFKAGINEYPNK